MPGEGSFPLQQALNFEHAIPFLIAQLRIHQKAGHRLRGFDKPESRTIPFGLPVSDSSPNIVYFDLETQLGAQDVGGWGHVDKMRLSIGVTYSTARGTYEIYTEDQADDLVKELQRADCVVGFNVIKFDYTVLTPYTLFDFSQIPTLDLMVSLEKKVGHRLKLDDVAKTTLSLEQAKTADGTDALRWWKEGKLMEIAEYCCYDVKVTKMVHEFGAEHGHVSYRNKKTLLEQEVPVEWKVEPPAPRLL